MQANAIVLLLLLCYFAIVLFCYDCAILCFIVLLYNFCDCAVLATNRPGQCYCATFAIVLLCYDCAILCFIVLLYNLTCCMSDNTVCATL